jgi:hypothetical protein
MHIIGYGTTARVDTTDPQQVIAAIQGNHGIAVIAHPRDEAFDAIAAFEPLPDGIEVWNSKYDGQYAPRACTFALLARLQARRPDLHAFYGIDLHWRRQFRELFVEIAAETMQADAILGALRQGQYVGIKGGLRLPSDGTVPHAVLQRFEAAHMRSVRMRRWIGKVKSVVDALGVAVPRPVKAQLRRIF